jgi:hypothetical protein
MAGTNFIHNAKIGRVNNTGTLNMGDTKNIHPSRNLKVTGISFGPFGDYSWGVYGRDNTLIDSDMVDQTS